MKNVSKKLLAAITEVGGTVEKTGWNSFSKYKYITESDINKAILPALIKQGLLLTTSVEGLTEEPSSEKNKNRFATINLSHKIIDTESGEVLELKSSGVAADTLDKAIYKAYTGACKYFLMKTFLISGDDTDPENDAGEAPRAPSPAPVRVQQQQTKPAPVAAPVAQPVAQKTTPVVTATPVTQTVTPTQKVSFGKKPAVTVAQSGPQKGPVDFGVPALDPSSIKTSDPEF